MPTFAGSDGNIFSHMSTSVGCLHSMSILVFYLVPLRMMRCETLHLLNSGCDIHDEATIKVCRDQAIGIGDVMDKINKQGFGLENEAHTLFEKMRSKTEMLRQMAAKDFEEFHEEHNGTSILNTSG